MFKEIQSTPFFHQTATSRYYSSRSQRQTAKLQTFEGPSYSPLSDPYSLSFERQNYLNETFRTLTGREPQPQILRNTGSNQGLEDTYQRTLIMPSRMTPQESNVLPQAAFLGSTSMFPTRFDSMENYRALQSTLRPTTTRFYSPGPNQLNEQQINIGGIQRGALESDLAEINKNNIQVGFNFRDQGPREEQNKSQYNVIPTPTFSAAQFGNSDINDITSTINYQASFLNQ